MGGAPDGSVGVIGLGRMGLPVAERLVAQGHRVVGFRRRWSPVAEGIGRVASPRAMTSEAAVILTCVPSDAALLEVIDGDEGLVGGATEGLVVVDLSMTSLATKQRACARLHGAGASMLDAPISGTPTVAAEGKASLFVSGDEVAYRLAEPYLSFAASAPLVGPFGTGSKLKYIANLLIGIHIAAAAEAMALAGRAGVDQDLVIDTISRSVAASEMFRHRAPRMARRDFEAPMNDVNAFLKDVELIEEFARSAGADAPLFQTAGDLYRRAAGEGLGDKELSAIVTLMSENSGDDQPAR